MKFDDFKKKEANPSQCLVFFINQISFGEHRWDCRQCTITYGCVWCNWHCRVGQCHFFLLTFLTHIHSLPLSRTHTHTYTHSLTQQMQRSGHAPCVWFTAMVRTGGAKRCTTAVLGTVRVRWRSRLKSTAASRAISSVRCFVGAVRCWQRMCIYVCESVFYVVCDVTVARVFNAL